MALLFYICDIAFPDVIDFIIISNFLKYHSLGDRGVGSFTVSSGGERSQWANRKSETTKRRNERQRVKEKRQKTKRQRKKKRRETTRREKIGRKARRVNVTKCDGTPEEPEKGRRRAGEELKCRRRAKVPVTSRRSAERPDADIGSSKKKCFVNKSS